MVEGGGEICVGFVVGGGWGLKQGVEVFVHFVFLRLSFLPFFEGFLRLFFAFGKGRFELFCVLTFILFSFWGDRWGGGGGGAYTKCSSCRYEGGTWWESWGGEIQCGGGLRVIRNSNAN